MRLALPALLLVVAGAYAGAASAGWYWDDARLILTNPVVTHYDLTAAFGHHLWWGAVGDPTDGLLYWRPLVLLSFMLDQALGGTPVVAHLQNVVWHLVVVALTYALARPRLGDTRALLAAGIAGLHPAASGAVLWVAARNDLLVTAALLGMLVALDRGRLILAAVLAFAAGLSKEIGLLALLFAVGWQLAWAAPSRSGLRAVAVGSAIAVTGRLLADVPPSTWSLEPRSFGLALAHSLAWLGAPWPLCGAVWLPAESFSGAIPGLLALAGILALSRPTRPWLWALAGLPLAPALVAAAGTDVAGEWYLYGPLAFGAIAASAGRARRAIYLAPVLLIWLVAIGIRVAEWADGTSLAEASVARAPSSWSWARLGAVYAANGRMDQAVDAFRTGLRLHPTFTRACGSAVHLLEHERPADLPGFQNEFPCARGR